MSGTFEQHILPASRLPEDAVVAILGLGLIGGSLGLALKTSSRCRVVGWNRSLPARIEAVRRGAVDEIAETMAECVQDADIVVIAAPVNVSAALLMEALPFLKSDAVVTDAGSVKAKLVAEAEKLLPGRFVGGHPMAGSEESGIAASSPSLFREATWVLTTTPLVCQSALDTVRSMVETVGARVRVCDPILHDAMVGTVSHLPHILAYGLAQTASDRIPDEWTDLPAGSFRDGARVALSDPALWTTILTDNRKSVVETMNAALGWMEQLRAALRNGDDSAVLDLLVCAHEARLRFQQVIKDRSEDRSV